MSYVLENSKEANRLTLQAKQRNYLICDEISTIDFSKHDKVLDVGCGNGLLTREIKSINPSLEVHGCDFSDIRLQQAKSEENLGIKYFNANAQDLNIDAEYDLIVSRYVFEHLSSPLSAANSAYKACKEGGKVCIIDFDGMFLNLFTSNKIFNKELDELRAGLEFDLYIGRKIPSLLYEVGFKNISWEIKTCVFKGEDLKDEIENCKQRCEFSLPVIKKILRSGLRAEKFVHNYIQSLSKPETVLFYNKFIVTAEK